MLFHVQAFDFGDVLEQAGGVHQHRRPRGRLGQRRDRGFLGDVDGVKAGLAARRLDLADDLGGRLRVDVGDDDLITRPPEALGRRPADPAGPAR